jgi:hypothetical protein
MNHVIEREIAAASSQLENHNGKATVASHSGRGLD